MYIYGRYMFNNLGGLGIFCADTVKKDKNETFRRETFFSLEEKNKAPKYGCQKSQNGNTNLNSSVTHCKNSENYDYKPSSIVAATSALVTGATAASTASAVVGGSAATIMSVTAGTTGAAVAATAGAAGTAGGAAIASGMATIGSVVGGGMATGAIITAAAPVAAFGGVVYGLFKLFED